MGYCGVGPEGLGSVPGQIRGVAQVAVGRQGRQLVQEAADGS